MPKDSFEKRVFEGIRDGVIDDPNSAAQALLARALSSEQSRDMSLAASEFRTAVDAFKEISTSNKNEINEMKKDIEALTEKIDEALTQLTTLRKEQEQTRKKQIEDLLLENEELKKPKQKPQWWNDTWWGRLAMAALMLMMGSLLWQVGQAIFNNPSGF